MPRHIAIVEDEPAIRDNYAEMLIRQGYQVSAYGSKQEAEVIFNEQLPDLVLLDIGLNDDIEGGFDLCRQLRQKSDLLPIIFLTARDNDFDTISGLRLGADDYLTKDISLPHLSACISALFRRLEAIHQQPHEEKLVITGKLTLNLERLEAQWLNQTIDLSLTEFWMVHSLVRHPGHVKSREQLMSDASTVVDDSTITSHIKRIRHKFMLIEQQFNCIETVYGAGYRWRCH
ncbi:MAG: proteobacterial dedicated sortase system response regulator [gamma proteobacterium symbiont of Bathyaustriella thionipta]|nr:proteobacterial dedicated sortase system response regulator [gamma proteobacterium symbiont of Bathyaustriella thionipta]